MFTIYGVLMNIMLFCFKIIFNFRCFVAKYVLLQFTRYCVEKNLAKNYACGEKRTNIMYAPTSRPLQAHPIHTNFTACPLCKTYQILNHPILV